MKLPTAVIQFIYRWKVG